MNQSSLHVKLTQVKEFLMKNPLQKHAAVARIFDVNVRTLTSFIRRETNKKKHEENNQILTKHEEEAIDDFIRSLLTYSISSTREMIFNAIVALKRAHDCDASSKR